MASAVKKIRCGFFAILIIFVDSFSFGTPTLSPETIRLAFKTMKGICMARHNVGREALSQVREGIFPDDDQSFKCFVHCYLTMMKVMKRDEITPEEATKRAEILLPEDMRIISIKQLDACKDVGGDDACDVAYNFAKCAYKTGPINWIFST